MWKLIKWPITYIVVQFSILFLLAIFYISSGKHASLFGQYLANNQIYLVLLLAIIFIPIFSMQYKKQKFQEKKMTKVSNWLNLIFVGIILSIFYNIVGFYISHVFPITNLYQENTRILITLLSTGLLGPVIEELLFRGIMYNEAKKIYSNMKSILLVTIIFAICHTSIIQIIYAFALGFILIYVYEKYHTVKAPIIVHMASNITTTLFLPFLIENHFIINYILFLSSLLILIFYWFKSRKQ